MASQELHAMVMVMSPVRPLVVGPLTGAGMATDYTATGCVFAKVMGTGLVPSQPASITTECSVD